MQPRRAYLALLRTTAATGLAGCGATVDGESRTTPTGSTGSEPPTERWRELAVEPAPVTAPDLDWRLEKRARASEEQPCTLRITVENTGSRRALTVSGRLPFPPTPGSPTEGETDVERPVLVPVDADYEPQYGGNCWQAAVDDPDVADDAPWDWGYGTEKSRMLEPGEAVDGTYYVVAEWTRYCFQRGTYRFDRQYRLDGTSYEWAFTLDVPSYDRDG